MSLPQQELVFTSDDIGPAPARSDKFRMLVSRSRPAKEALSVAKSLDADLIEMGSAGAKVMAVVYP